MRFIQQTFDNPQQGKDAGQADFEDVPLGDEDMAALFDYLEDVLDGEECDHGFDLTGTFLTSNDIAPRKVVLWLQRRGVVCDCDVLGEFEFAWRNPD